MSERRRPYPFDILEPKWQAIWEESNAFRAPNPGEPGFDPAQPKYYVLDMFPYPSGSGLHVGHPEGYTATDIVARYKRFRGFNVLHPIGWDAFGLPAEQYAIRTGQHPEVTTRQNIAHFKKQLKRIGFSYDWEREVSTADAGFFRWTQWIFLQIYHSWFNPETKRAEPIATYTGDDPDSVRLAYVAEVPVNWCPELGTVLANEEVIDGKSEVGGFPVVRRPMRQWMLRITSYAERLIDELEPLDWPEGIKLLQRNWIGKSTGAEVRFALAESDDVITVFTTRPDTLYGATYMVLAPENPLVDRLTTNEQEGAVSAYRAQVSAKSDLERTDLAKDKRGVFTGAYAINPANGERIPIWTADYVLMGYGTGAIMAVPAHDERDFEFARKFDLPILEVVKPEDGFASRHSRVENPAPVKDPAPVKSEDPAAAATARALAIEEGFFAPRGETEIHTRHLPHWQQDAALYFLTWRLADSLPKSKLKMLQEERAQWLKANPKPWSSVQEREWDERFQDQIDDWLDAGTGECLLRDPANAQIVVDALRFFEGQRYWLHGYVVMPNHVHLLVRLAPGEELPVLLHSWKRHSGREINRRLERTGSLWQEEYYDRLVRSWEHFENLQHYIAANPEKAGLVPGIAPVWVKPEDGFASRLSRVENPAPVKNPASLFTGDGVAINSSLIDGLPTPEAKERITAWLEERGLGRRTINYKLRDWLFSRQRYWGEPFPIVWQEGKHRAIHESELPLVPPPLDDFKPTGTGEPPLARAKDWVRYSDTATRELNTMPQWAGSCWYYLRFCDPGNEERFVGVAPERYWMGNGNDEAQNKIRHSETDSLFEIRHSLFPAQPGGVDLYVGGTEHAVLHLLYARFWHKVLFDLGHLSTGEPFQRLVNQGIILGEDGRKMSKRWGNVIDPLDVIAEYGADAFRCYEMFMGPLEQMKPWSMTGVEGVSRFLARVWRLAMEENQEGEWVLSDAVQEVEPTRPQLKVIHATVKKVGEDIEALSFNTAIAQMMIFVNAFTSPPGSARASRAGAGASPATVPAGSVPGGTLPARAPETAGGAPALPGVSRSVPVAALRTLLVLLNPFAPHLTSELWERLGERFPITPNEITGQPWPDYQPEFLVEDEVEIALQVNGKVRDRLMVPIGASKAELEALARANPRVQEFIAGKTVRKVVVVEKKLVNVVAT